MSSSWACQPRTWRPAAAGGLAAVRQGAAALADFYAAEIEQLGLENNQAVREALAKYRYALEQALTVDEVAQAMSTRDGTWPM